MKYTAMTDSLYEYMIQLMPEPPALADVSDYTRQVEGGHMKSPREQVLLFQLLLRISRAQRALEIGVFTGYSALGIAQALPEDGTLLAFERDRAVLEVAKSFWEKAGVAHKIQAVEGDAAVMLGNLVAAGDSAGTFDFAFIDANKRKQREYYELCLDLVRPGGLIVVDNVLWYGRVVEEGRKDKITLSIRDLNDFLSRDDRIDLTVIPVGDGIAVCLVK